MLYERRGKINRNGFVRTTDRPIFEQKAEIQDLINRGITENIYNSIIESHPELIDNKVAINFTLIDNEKIENIKFGTY